MSNLLSRIRSTANGGILSPGGMSMSGKYSVNTSAPKVTADASGILSQVMSGAKSAYNKMQREEELRRKQEEERQREMDAAKAIMDADVSQPGGILPSASEDGSGVSTYPLDSQPTIDGKFVPENEREQAIVSAVDNTVNKYVAQGDVPESDAQEVRAHLLAIAEIESSMGRNNRGPRIGIDIEGDPAHYGQRALGPFQFMPSTAQSYGLNDPMDIIASTDAAMRHLLTGYKQKGDWRKAAIGHHSGPHYKKLGKWGRDYANKLEQKVGKYYS